MQTNIMDLDIKNLSQKQYEYLKNNSIRILNEIIEKLKEDKLQEIEDMLEFSPSGDCMGSDNCYIEFSYNKDITMDLDNILTKMAALKNIELKRKGW